MRFLRFLRKKASADVNFEAVRCGCMTLENNFDGLIRAPKRENVRDYLDRMFEDEREFVTLTLPECRDGIRYMQACRVPNGISLQIGREENGTVKLLEKVYGREEVAAAFDGFYCCGRVENPDAFGRLFFGRDKEWTDILNTIPKRM